VLSQTLKYLAYVLRILLAVYTVDKDIIKVDDTKVIYKAG